MARLYRSTYFAQGTIFLVAFVVVTAFGLFSKRIFQLAEFEITWEVLYLATTTGVGQLLWLHAVRNFSRPSMVGIAFVSPIIALPLIETCLAVDIKGTAYLGAAVVSLSAVLLYVQRIHLDVLDSIWVLAIVVLYVAYAIPPQFETTWTPSSTYTMSLCFALFAAFEAYGIHRFSRLIRKTQDEERQLRQACFDLNGIVNVCNNDEEAFEEIIPAIDKLLRSCVVFDFFNHAKWKTEFAEEQQYCGSINDNIDELRKTAADFSDRFTPIQASKIDGHVDALSKHFMEWQQTRPKRIPLIEWIGLTFVAMAVIALSMFTKHDSFLIGELAAIVLSFFVVLTCALVRDLDENHLGTKIDRFKIYLDAYSCIGLHMYLPRQILFDHNFRFSVEDMPTVRYISRGQTWKQSNISLAEPFYRRVVFLLTLTLISFLLTLLFLRYA